VPTAATSMPAAAIWSAVNFKAPLSTACLPSSLVAAGARRALRLHADRLADDLRQVRDEGGDSQPCQKRHHNEADATGHEPGPRRLEILGDRLEFADDGPGGWTPSVRCNAQA